MRDARILHLINVKKILPPMSHKLLNSKISSPFIVVGIFSTKVERFELIGWRMQLDGGLLASKRLLTHRVALKVDPT